MVSSVPRLELREELRLDAETEDFSAIGQLSVGPGGVIAIPQRQDRRVLLYDAAGKRVASVGRRGEGPGEFQSPGPMGWIADTLWIYDHTLRRIVVAHASGTVVRTQTLPPSLMLHAQDGITTLGTLGFYAPSAIYPDGGLLVGGRYIAPGGTQLSPHLIALVTPDSLARVLVHPASFEDPRWMLEVEGFGRSLPFTIGPTLSTSADGRRFATMETSLTSADSGEITLAVYRWGGVSWDTIPQVRRVMPFVGAPIPRAAIDSALADFLPQPGQPREGPDDLPRRFQALARERMPSVYTPVVGMRLGIDETIWLDLLPTADGRGHLMLDGKGTPIGTIVLPSNSTMRQGSAREVWVTERDDRDLVSVVRYRIGRPRP